MRREVRDLAALEDVDVRHAMEILPATVGRRYFVRLTSGDTFAGAFSGVFLGYFEGIVLEGIRLAFSTRAGLARFVAPSLVDGLTPIGEREGATA